MILGFIIALSSTVVAMKMLDEMGELRSGARQGRGIGVLIAQDIGRCADADPGFEPGRRGASISAEVAIKVVVAVALLAGLLLWWFGRNPKLKLPFAEAIENNVDLLGDRIAGAVLFGRGTVRSGRPVAGLWRVSCGYRHRQLDTSEAA
jgi:CPA2 family monovalent cation:H+ antiporter-2